MFSLLILVIKMQFVRLYSNFEQFCAKPPHYFPETSRPWVLYTILKNDWITDDLLELELKSNATLVSTYTITAKNAASVLRSDSGSGFFKSSASNTVSESMMSKSSTMSVAARVQAVAADSVTRTQHHSLHISK